MGGRVVYLSEVPADKNYQLFEEVADVLKRKQVAELLGVDEKTVSREVARGKLGCFHVGRSLRFTKQQLIDYVKECEAC